MCVLKYISLQQLNINQKHFFPLERTKISKIKEIKTKTNKIKLFFCFQNDKTKLL